MITTSALAKRVPGWPRIAEAEPAPPERTSVAKTRAQIAALRIASNRPKAATAPKVLHDNRRDINPHDPDLSENDLLFALPTFLVLMSQVTTWTRRPNRYKPM
jgi:hypothetical protein